MPHFRIQVHWVSGRAFEPPDRGRIMSETIAFLMALAATVYLLVWFWKNDDGPSIWKKKPFDPRRNDRD